MTTRLSRALLFVTGIGLLSGCATPLDIGNANRTLSPKQAVAAFDTARHQAVAWGGVIVAGRNLKDMTEFEILGYPLDDQNSPDTHASPIGRFITQAEGYLETADYAPGREVTVIGVLQRTRDGKVGEASYTYPVVNATRVYLWPVQVPSTSNTQFHFGIGIGIHN
jgi:outer membrane lipoprotein